MRNVKFLLPMLAFICAIGMAFATVDLKPEPVLQAQDYILLNGNTWVSIPEQNCAEGQFTCRVQDGDNGPYDVYDEMYDDEPKSSSSPQINPVDL